MTPSLYVPVSKCCSKQPYDQIINSTGYLEFINAVEHGHVGLDMTAQGAVSSLP